jgi:hypothetical protein
MRLKVALLIGASALLIAPVPPIQPRCTMIEVNGWVDVVCSREWNGAPRLIQFLPPTSITIIQELPNE